MRLGVLFSGGKDSNYSMYLMKNKGHEIACLITMKSKNPDSYMFHTPAIDLTEIQAEALQLPIVYGDTTGEKEKELIDLKNLLMDAKKKYKLEGIITGALYSNYQRERIEMLCCELKLEVFSPLWHVNQEHYLRQLIKDGFKIILTSVAAEGLDKSFLGRTFTEKDVDRLAQINKKCGINVAFEGGEAESLVVDSPMFKRKVDIVKSEIKMENKNCGRMFIEKAKLIDK